jgi:hypothetical protein
VLYFSPEKGPSSFTKRKRYIPITSSPKISRTKSELSINPYPEDHSQTLPKTDPKPTPHPPPSTPSPTHFKYHPEVIKYLKKTAFKISEISDINEDFRSLQKNAPPSPSEKNDLNTSLSYTNPCPNLNDSKISTSKGDPMDTSHISKKSIIRLKKTSKHKQRNSLSYSSGNLRYLNSDSDKDEGLGVELGCNDSSIEVEMVLNDDGMAFFFGFFYFWVFGLIGV